MHGLVAANVVPNDLALVYMRLEGVTVGHSPSSWPTLALVYGQVQAGHANDVLQLRFM